MLWLIVDSRSGLLLVLASLRASPVGLNPEFPQSGFG